MTHTTPINDMVKALDKAFAGFDELHLEADLKWHRDTLMAGQQFDQAVKAGEVDLSKYDCPSLRRQVKWKMRVKAYGGLTAFKLFTGSNWSMIADHVHKNHKAKVAKRNHRIVRDLTRAGITKVIDGDVELSTDGFNCRFAVQTDKGDRNIFVSTIYCHGAIKRPHFRVVVRVSV